MELNQIPQNPNNWGNVADLLNENSGKIEAETAKLNNVTTKFKGYFSNSTALSVKWPSPLVGDTAWVGATYPGVVYRCDVAGAWLATTDVPPSNTVNLSEYATQDAVSNEFASVRSDLNEKATTEAVSNVKWDSVNSPHGVVFTDKKDSYAPLSLFENGLVIGQKYTITNLSDISIGFYAYDVYKQQIEPLGTNIQPNTSVTFIFNTQNTVYVGGWGNTLEYKISLKYENQDITSLQEQIIEGDNNLNYKKSARNPITEIDNWINGYIHSNASAGVIVNEDYRTSTPFFVKKGSVIHLSYSNGGSNSAIAKVDITATPYTYTKLVGSEQYNFVHGTIKEFIYEVTEEMYIAVCGYKDYLNAYVDDNYYYKKKEILSTKINTVAGQSFIIPFNIIKGNRYLVENTGSYDTSFVTRYAEDSPVIDTIKSEQITDQVLTYSLLKNSWSIFVASDDANYITGWCANVTTIIIKDITNKNIQYFSNNPNVIFQSREARVSSIYYPNQSKYGILEAAKNQYDRVRFTVRKTTDGYYFLCHNATINALAKNLDGSDISEQVSSTGKTLSELNAYDWGIYYGQKYAGMNVPLLDDALHFASLCNLSVTLEVSFSETEEDVANMMSLCTKYGLTKNLIIIKSRYFVTYPYYQTISPKISYFWDGTEAQFDSEIGTIRQFKSGENQIYIMCAPIGDAPNTNFLAKIIKEGFTPYYSLVFNKEQFKSALGQGYGLIESANVPFVKDLTREYVETLI